MSHPDRADRHPKPRIYIGGSSLRVAIILLSLLPGCGYQMAGVGDPDPKSGYQWKSLYRGDVQTVAVPIFINRTLRQGLGTQMTTSVIEQLELHSPYKVVPADRADTILEGIITDMNTTTLSTDNFTGLPQEQSVNLTVSFTWKNLRTGVIYAQRKNFDQHTSYFPTLGEDQSIGTADAVQRLALGVVQELQADW